MGDLIHPDALSPRDEFEGYLDELVREARHHPNQPVDDDALIAALTAKATELAEAMGGEPEPFVYCGDGCGWEGTGEVAYCPDCGADVETGGVVV